jgi:hypothetical protein
MADPFREAVNHALCDELAAALGRVAHCLGQLTDEQIWQRPKPDMNSIGNLVLHLTGNVHQLMVSGLGAAPDDRDRPAEFAARGPIPGDELLERLVDEVKRARQALIAASSERLCGPVGVGKYDWTAIQAAVRSVAHFRGHTQEIIHMTRFMLGESYQYAGPR